MECSGQQLRCGTCGARRALSGATHCHCCRHRQQLAEDKNHGQQKGPVRGLCPPADITWNLQVIIWSGKRDSNSRPQPWQGCALPTELFPRIECDSRQADNQHSKMCCKTGAGNETRTRDLNLGKVALYQLSYSRRLATSIYSPTHKKHGLTLETGAGNETRTRDLNLGKVALYQLSYSRLGGEILHALAAVSTACSLFDCTVPGGFFVLAQARPGRAQILQRRHQRQQGGDGQHPVTYMENRLAHPDGFERGVG